MSKLIVGDVETNSINGGPLAGFRNAIINGNFDHWQRGTSLSAATGNRYLSDRWLNLADTSTVAPSQQQFALGQTDVPNEPEYFHRSLVSSVAGVNSNALLMQRIEDVRSFAGQTVIVSFYAKADAAKNIAVEFEQVFGTGGSPSPNVNTIGVTTLALTTTFQKFTVTVAIPSIAGKTIGTGGNDRLQMLFWFDSGSNFNARNNSLGHQSGTFDIAQVQLEAGSVATPFERRPVGTELALCQRYFQRLPIIVAGEAAFADRFISFFASVTWLFAVPMRATPSVGFASGSSVGATNISNQFVRVFDTADNCVIAQGSTADSEL